MTPFQMARFKLFVYKQMSTIITSITFRKKLGLRL